MSTMKKVLSVTLAFTASAVLAGCTIGGEPVYPELPNPTIQIPDTPGQLGEVNDHGLVEKDFGEPGFSSDPETSERILALAPISISGDWPCDVPSVNGAYLAFAFEIKTTPAFHPVHSLGEDSFQFTDGTFEAFADDGTAVDTPVPNQSQCVPSHLSPPQDLVTNQSGIGWVLFDLPEDAASIAYIPSWGGGWEWQLP